MTVPASPPSLPSSSAAQEGRREGGARFAAAWIGVVVLTAVTVALLTGSEPSMPAARSMMVGSFTLLAGACLLPGFLRPDRAGWGARWAARFFAASGSVMALAYFLAWAHAVLPSGNLELSTYGLLIKNFTVGKALVAAMVIGVSYVLVDTISGRRGGSWSGHLGIMAALAATLPVSLAGHAAHGSSTFSDLMVLTMIGHVFGAMCWVGGLAALGGWHLVTRGDLSEALPRFSRVAAICISVVAATGIVNGAVILADSEIGISAVVTHPYGHLLIAKTVALVGLAVCGARMRFAVLPHIKQRPVGAGMAWLVVEVILMALTFGIASVLATTPPV